MSAVEGAAMHATAVVYGETGVLILGPSGSGKSALALALLGRARDIGVFGALVGDDRIWARAIGGRLVAAGAKQLAGMIERRAVGLVAAPYEPNAVIGLAVELNPRLRPWPRLPDEPDEVTIEGVRLPRLALDSTRSAADQALAVDERLGSISAAHPARKGISLEHSAAVHKNGPLTGARSVRRTPEA
jgi:serine kinase of HPr protein (carbohydrate metabolism regulator)